MIPGAFAYHRPTTTAEAVQLLASLGDDSRVLAGGHSLIPMMKLRLAAPEHIIDLQDIDELRGIDENNGMLSVGAMVSQHEIIESDLLAQRCPILSEAARQIADPQVRYCGTLGGNLANGDPGNDMPAVMVALGATYRVEGPTGDREIAARDFYQGVFTTALDTAEVVTAIRIPTPPAGHGYAYEKQKRKIGDYATAAAAVVLDMSGGSCRSAAIALTNVGDTPLHAEAASQALAGTTADGAAVDEAVRLAESITAPASDLRGPAGYRTRIAGIMTRRAIGRALERAG